MGRCACRRTGGTITAPELVKKLRQVGTFCGDITCLQLLFMHLAMLEACTDLAALASAQVAEDKQWAGVILRIDSPGGDALASDLIWHAHVAALCCLRSRFQGWGGGAC